MALIGGAGNPVGGSFTGPAEALEVIGDHAYAASGPISDPSSGSAATTLLKFTSGNFYFVGWMNFSNDEIASNTVFLEMTYNGAVVVSDDSGNPGNPTVQMYYILIPPYTEVELKWGCNVTRNATAFITGEIYRTRD
jgi:hypothetical protein